MKVQIQLYAQLRDIVGSQSVLFDLPCGASISDLLENLYSKFPALRAQDQAILTGVGVEFVDRNYKIQAGDDVAIMPPVQGG
jgi:MoaD family protein